MRSISNTAAIHTDNLPCPVIQINRQQEVIYCNHAACSLKIVNSGLLCTSLMDTVRSIFNNNKKEAFECVFDQQTFSFQFQHLSSCDSILLIGTDVTVQKRKQKKNEERKEFYEQILSNIPVDIAVFSSDYKFKYVNPVAVKNDEVRSWLIGKTEFDYAIHRNKPLARAELRTSMFQRMIEQQESSEWVESYAVADQTKYFLRKFHPVRSETGNVDYVLGCGIDITNQVALEKKYEEAAKYTRENPNAVLKLNSKGQMAFGNKSGQRFYNDWLRQHNDKRVKLFQELKKDHNLKTKFSFRKNIGDKSYSIKVIPDTDGTSYNLYATDISLQMAARRIIIRKDKLLEGVANAAKELLSNSNLDTAIRNSLAIIGKKAAVDRVYVFENRRGSIADMHLHHRYEWSRSGVSRQIDNPQLKEMSYQMLPGVFQVLSEKKPFSNTIANLDGTLKLLLEAQGTLSILLIPIFVKEKFWGFIGFDDCHEERVWTRNDEALLTAMGSNVGEAIIKDQIERERESLFESLSIKTKKLKESNEELEQFAFVASHDLKQPLRTIASFAQLIDMRYGDQLDDKGRKYIDFMVNATDRMYDLINDLLNYSRISRTEVNYQSTDLNLVLNEVLENLNASITESNARMRCDSMPEIYCDKAQIAQLFQNLIDNSIKFKSEETPEILVKCIERESEHLFVVQDNGIGMEMAYSERIFQVFQQLDNANKAMGTGVGLSICKKIAERHRGNIWIESTPGQGTTFYFTISKQLSPAKIADSKQLV